MSKGYKKMLDAVGEPQDKDDVIALLKLISEYYPDFIFEGSSVGSKDEKKQSLALFSYDEEASRKEASGATAEVMLLTMLSTALASFTSELDMDTTKAAELLLRGAKKTSRSFINDNVHEYKSEENND